MSSHKHRKNTSAHHSSKAGAHNHQSSHKPTMRATRAPRGFETKQLLIVAALAVVAFLGAYSIARSGSSASSAGLATPQTAGTQFPAVNATGRASAGAATIENGVQKVAVQVGFTYTPDVIRLKAGMPAEITFGEGQGCTAVVQSEVLGFQEDLTTGPRTVKLQGLAPGSYEFACGMNMVRGQIVVS